MYHPGLDPGPGKKKARLNIIGATDKICIRAVDLIIVVLNHCKFPDFDNYATVMDKKESSYSR